jgi:hypothetical protein
MQLRNLKKLFDLFVLLLLGACLSAQTKVAVLHLNTEGIPLTPKQAGNLARIELNKLDSFRVLDKFDMYDKLKKEGNINPDSCYGESCLAKAGQQLEVDKMLSGSVERYHEKLVITLRWIDVQKGELEKSTVHEFQNQPEQLQRMLQVQLQEFFNRTPDKTLAARLSYQESPVHSASKKLILNGPRMGASYITGDFADRLQAPLNKGGYDSYPVLTQFGYQHEVQYMSAGNFQG